jgi:hypothetical protein
MFSISAQVTALEGRTHPTRSPQGAPAPPQSIVFLHCHNLCESFAVHLVDRNNALLDVHVAEALSGTAEGSYEQEAALEEDEEMKGEDEGGVAKRPDKNTKHTFLEKFP